MTTDDQIRILERFNETVDRIKRHGFVEEARGGGAIVEIGGPQGSEGIHVGPSEKTIDATVIVLRFFIQDRESTSLSNMADLYSSLNIESELCTQFSEIRDRLNGFLDSPLPIVLPELGPLTFKDLRDAFIYGHLSHANPEKEANYDFISKIELFPIFEDIFTKMIVIHIKALHDLQQINCKALEQLRRDGTGTDVRLG